MIEFHLSMQAGNPFVSRPVSPRLPRALLPTSLQSNNRIPSHEGHLPRHENLGHKDVKNTLVYIDLEHEIFQNINEDQFTTKVAYTHEEACKLREVGFEKFDEFNGAHLYCKRKWKKARGCIQININ